MTEKIFTLVPNITRKELFLKIIDIMVNAGWVIKNPNTSQRYIMFSDGVDGKTPMLIELVPFEYPGIRTQVNDLRNATGSIGTSAWLRYVTSYNPDTDTAIYVTSAYTPIPIGVHAKDYRYVDERGEFHGRDLQLDMHYYADKSRIMFMLNYKRNSSSRTGGMFTVFGLPEKSYLENREDFPSDFTVMSSGGSFTANYQVMVAQRPKIWPTNSVRYVIDIRAIMSPKSPNVDREYMMSKLYTSRSDEGFRSMWDGFYIMNWDTYLSYNIQPGDIVEIKRGSKVEKYKVFWPETNSDGNAWSYVTFYQHIIFLRIE